MRKGRLLSILCTAIIIASCASTGTAGSAAGGPDLVSASLLSVRDVRNEFGLAYAENPFLFATTFQTTDFLVVKIAVRASARETFSVLQSEALDQSGTVFASAYNRADFKQQAEYMSAQIIDQSMRRNKIGWYYLPSTTFTVDPGQHEYIIVLGGKHPLPAAGLSVVVRVTLNDVESDFTLGVPEKQK